MAGLWTGRWAVLLAAALGCFTLFSAAAPAPAQEAERKVSLNLKDVPLRSAIDALFQGTGLQYAVDPNVPNVPVTLNIRDIGLQPALRILIRQAAVAVPGLTQSRDGDIYVVKIRSMVAAPAQPAGEDAPPEFGEEEQEVTWEKIPVQFNNVAVFVLAFGGQMLPTEADVLLGGGGGGGFGGGGFGGGGFGGGLGGFGGGGFGGGGFGGLGGGGLGGFGGGGFGGLGGGGLGGFGGGGFGGLGGGGLGGFGGGGLGGFGGGGLGGFGGGGFGGGGFGGGGFGGGGFGGRF